jgi:hypothetical protein
MLATLAANCAHPDVYQQSESVMVVWHVALEHTPMKTAASVCLANQDSSPIRTSLLSADLVIQDAMFPLPVKPHVKLAVPTHTQLSRGRTSAILALWAVSRIWMLVFKHVSLARAIRYLLFSNAAFVCLIFDGSFCLHM